LALSPIDLQKIDALSWDSSLKASHVIVAAIEAKAQLLLGLGEAEREKNFARKNVSGWLENNLPAITKLLTDASNSAQSEGK
jgi:hypothetical protein